MSKTYKNVDKKHSESPCELIMEIKLVYPYNASLEQVLSMIRVWDMRLIQSKHLAPDIQIAIKYEKFIKLFGDIPIIIGKEYPLKGVSKMISQLKLLSVLVGNSKME